MSTTGCADTAHASTATADPNTLALALAYCWLLGGSEARLPTALPVSECLPRLRQGRG